VAAAVASALVLVPGPMSHSAAARPSGDAPAGRLTLLFGRTQWASTAQCERLPGSVTLRQVAVAMRGRGLVGTGTVVVARTPERGWDCVGYALHPGWRRLANLRDRFGWTFVSAGLTYAPMTQLRRSQRVGESCGSLEAFRAHGHHRAWGLFAYPGNDYGRHVQRRVVSRCFAYGRTYGLGVNERADMGAPWFQKTFSVNGGACHDRSRPCRKIRWAGATHRYVLPSELARALRPARGQWSTVQFYRFVRGKQLEGFQRWDCTGEDTTRHWTSRSELYCFRDLKVALNKIDPATIVTDPASVARVWGRASRMTPPLSSA
jgi:hypothetical protein